MGLALNELKVKNNQSTNKFKECISKERVR